MSAYTEEFLVDKLDRLVNTQESIQTLSEWVKFHKKRCDKSVEVWDRELYKAPKERKLVFLYLANDIMQTSRRRGGEFIKEFAKVLPRAILHVQREGDKDDKKAVSRLLGIWQERRVFTPEYIDGIAKSLQGQAGPSDQLTAHIPAELDVPPMSPPNKNDPLVTLLRTVAGREVELALAEEKVQAIRPQLMSGEALITCLNQSEVTELAIELDETITVLGSFCKSLEEDGKSRAKLLEAMKKFMETQQQQKEVSQKKLKECKQELTKTEALKEQLKILYEKLPPGPTLDELEPALQPIDPRTQSPQKRASLSDDVTSPGKRAKVQVPQTSAKPQSLSNSRAQPTLNSVHPSSSMHPSPPSIHPSIPPVVPHHNNNLLPPNYYNNDLNSILPPDMNFYPVQNPTPQNYLHVNPLNNNLNNMNLNNHIQGMNQPPLNHATPPPNDYSIQPDFQNYLNNDQYPQMANFQYGYMKPVQ